MQRKREVKGKRFRESYCIVFIEEERWEGEQSKTTRFINFPTPISILPLCVLVFFFLMD